MSKSAFDSAYYVPSFLDEFKVSDDPRIADLSQQLSEANAKVAMLHEALTLLTQHALCCEEELDVFHQLGDDAGSGCSTNICEANEALAATSADATAWKNELRAQTLESAADAHDNLQECCVTVKELRRLASEIREEKK